MERELAGKESEQASEGKTTKQRLVNNDDGTSAVCMRLCVSVCILHSKISCIKIVSFVCSFVRTG